MSEEEDWSAGTFEGLVDAQRRTIAGWTPLQRLEWLEEAIDLALASGALERVFAEKQRLIDEAWAEIAGESD